MTKYRLAIAQLWGIGFTSLACLLMNLNGFVAFFLLPGPLVAFALGFLMFRKAGLTELRRIAGWSVLPVTVVATLACFPSLNPLFPHGMTELAKQESELQVAIPPGTSLEQVRGVLNLKKIQFYESTEPSDGVILQNQQTTMTGQAGDTVVVSRFQTEAFELPCGYDMQIVLVFGRERGLKQRTPKEYVRMPKRLFAGVVGVLSLCACYIASALAYEALGDFRYSGIERWAILDELTMCLMAITSFTIGLRFLRFAWTGAEFSIGGSLRPLFLGAGLFFPGFVFSLPLTMFVGSHFAPVGKQDEWVLIGMGVSFCVGLVIAIVSSIMLFKKSKTRRGMS